MSCTIPCMRNKNMYQFWKEIRKRKACIRKTAQEIDTVTNAADVASLFKGKFSVISGSTSAPLSFAERFDTDECVVPTLSYSNVRDAINKTNTGVGIYGVHSNHLKFLYVYATRFLTKFLYSCILHRYVPRDMLEGYIKPSVKNSMGDITDSNNYRELMISNNMFSLLEYCL